MYNGIVAQETLKAEELFALSKSNAATLAFLVRILQKYLVSTRLWQDASSYDSWDKTAVI